MKESRKLILTSFLLLSGILTYGQENLSLKATLNNSIRDTSWSYGDLRVVIHPSWKGFSIFKSESYTNNKVGMSFEGLPIQLSIRRERDKYIIKCEHSFCIGPDQLPDWERELSKQDLMLIDKFLSILIKCPFDMTSPTFEPDNESIWYGKLSWKINPEYNRNFPENDCKELSFYPIFQKIFSKEIESLIRKREEFRTDFDKKFFRKWYFNPAVFTDPVDNLIVSFRSKPNKTDSACLTLTNEHRIIFTSSSYSMNSKCDFLLFYDSYNFGYFPYFGLLDYSLNQEIFGKSNNQNTYFEVMSLTSDQMTLRLRYK